MPARPRSRRVALLGAVGLLLTALTAPAAAAAVSPAASGISRFVSTDKGAVRGTLSTGLRTFQGIPYAAPPVGERRFEAPQPAPRWRGVLDATAPRSQCAQLVRLGNPETFGEDCLYLNVTTPARPELRGLPVMLWIHGGAFVYGNGARYDASKLAIQGDVIVVTINYRLGPLGFLAHPALSAERPGVGSGNLALEDQQAALAWVQRNAAAFGGDPRRVTVFGESAGASAVCANLVSPAAAGLFSRAIAQSYSCAAPYATRAEAEQTGRTVAERVGCTDPATAAACLRRTPSEALLRAWPGGAFVVGGSLLPLQPADAFRAGRHHRVPLVHGSNLDEMRLYVGLEYDGAGRPLTAEQYVQVVRATYGAAADRVLELYPLSAYPSPSIALATIRTDFGSVLSSCAHLSAYRAVTDAPGDVPVYAYQFRDRQAPPLVEVPGYEEGAEHAVELNFIFPRLFGGPLTPAQQELSSAMVGYWTTFARTGDPNTRGLPRWPVFVDGDDVLGLDTGRRGTGGIHPVHLWRNSNCGFWWSLPAAS